MARMLEPLTIPERVMLLQTLARCEIVYQTYMPEELGTARVRKAFSDLHARLTAIIKVATILREHPDMSAATIKLPGAEGEAHIPPSERVAKMVTLLANVEVSHAQGEVLQRIRGPCPQPISEWYSWYSRKPPAITLGNAIGALFSRS
ncbi:hypothetical protein MMC34_008101 [Xylographa carneopallida]|nr:hypothetical protein [Xylographa carneopallida]